MATIRVAAESDIETLTTLIRCAFGPVAKRFYLTPENCPKHPSNCTAEWITADLARGAAYYIIDRDGQALGCAALERASANECYLERLAVLPDHHRQGLGRALVEHLVQRARAMGAQKIGIGIIAADIPLKSWYAGLGFVVGATKTFAHLPFQVLLMSKALSSQSSGG